MIKILILSAICIYTACCGQNPSSKEVSKRNNNMEYENCSNFIGKEINLFLKDKCFANYKEIIIMEYKPGKASSLLIVYNSNISIEIFPDGFKYMDPTDFKIKWEIEKFKLETIKEIIVYKNDVVFKVFK